MVTIADNQELSVSLDKQGLNWQFTVSHQLY